MAAPPASRRVPAWVVGSLPSDFFEATITGGAAAAAAAASPLAPEAAEKWRPRTSQAVTPLPPLSPPVLPGLGAAHAGPALPSSPATPIGALTALHHRSAVVGQKIEQLSQRQQYELQQQEQAAARDIPQKPRLQLYERPASALERHASSSVGGRVARAERDAAGVAAAAAMAAAAEAARRRGCRQPGQVPLGLGLTGSARRRSGGGALPPAVRPLGTGTGRALLHSPDRNIARVVPLTRDGEGGPDHAPSDGRALRMRPTSGEESAATSTGTENAQRMRALSLSNRAWLHPRSAPSTPLPSGPPLQATDSAVCAATTSSDVTTVGEHLDGANEDLWRGDAYDESAEERELSVVERLLQLAGVQVEALEPIAADPIMHGAAQHIEAQLRSHFPHSSSAVAATELRRLFRELRACRYPGVSDGPNEGEPRETDGGCDDWATVRRALAQIGVGLSKEEWAALQAVVGSPPSEDRLVRAVAHAGDAGPPRARRCYPPPLATPSLRADAAAALLLQSAKPGTWGGGGSGAAVLRHPLGAEGSARYASYVTGWKLWLRHGAVWLQLAVGSLAPRRGIGGGAMVVVELACVAVHWLDVCLRWRASIAPDCDARLIYKLVLLCLISLNDFGALGASSSRGDWTASLDTAHGTRLLVPVLLVLDHRQLRQAASFVLALVPQAASLGMACLAVLAVIIVGCLQLWGPTLLSSTGQTGAVDLLMGATACSEAQDPDDSPRPLPITVHALLYLSTVATVAATLSFVMAACAETAQRWRTRNAAAQQLRMRLLRRLAIAIMDTECKKGLNRAQFAELHRALWRLLRSAASTGPKHPIAPPCGQKSSEADSMPVVATTAATTAAAAGQAGSDDADDKDDDGNVEEEKAGLISCQADAVWRKIVEGMRTAGTSSSAPQLVGEEALAHALAAVQGLIAAESAESELPPRWICAGGLLCGTELDGIAEPWLQPLDKAEAEAGTLIGGDPKTERRRCASRRQQVVPEPVLVTRIEHTWTVAGNRQRALPDRGGDAESIVEDDAASVDSVHSGEGQKKAGWLHAEKVLSRAALQHTPAMRRRGSSLLTRQLWLHEVPGASCDLDAESVHRWRPPQLQWVAAGVAEDDKGRRRPGWRPVQSAGTVVGRGMQLEDMDASEFSSRHSLRLRVRLETANVIGGVHPWHRPEPSGCGARLWYVGTPNLRWRQALVWCWRWCPAEVLAMASALLSTAAAHQDIDAASAQRRHIAAWACAGLLLMHELGHVLGVGVEGYWRTPAYRWQLLTSIGMLSALVVDSYHERGHEGPVPAVVRVVLHMLRTTRMLGFVRLLGPEQRRAGSIQGAVRLVRLTLAASATPSGCLLVLLLALLYMHAAMELWLLDSVGNAGLGERLLQDLLLLGGTDATCGLTPLFYNVSTTTAGWAAVALRLLRLWGSWLLFLPAVLLTLAHHWRVARQHRAVQSPGVPADNLREGAVNAARAADHVKAVQQLHRSSRALHTRLGDCGTRCKQRLLAPHTWPSLHALLGGNHAVCTRCSLPVKCCGKLHFVVMPLCPDESGSPVLDGAASAVGHTISAPPPSRALPTGADHLGMRNYRGFEPLWACSACIAWNAAMEMRIRERWLTGTA